MNASPRKNLIRVFVYLSLVVWFVIALRMGLHGALASRPGLPPITLGLSILVPIAIYSLIYADHGAFWRYCQGLDFRVITILHLWRILGLDFLVNWSHGKLPAGFAFPAGIGDIVVALTAIPLVYALSRNRRSARSWFIAWNVVGLIDLILAVTMGVLHSGSSIGVLAGNGPTTALMSQLPRSLIPTFFVPLFMLLHMLALSRSRDLGERKTSDKERTFWAQEGCA
jgi:hypothetical protein